MAGVLISSRRSTAWALSSALLGLVQRTHARRNCYASLRHNPALLRLLQRVARAPPAPHLSRIFNANRTHTTEPVARLLYSTAHHARHLGAPRASSRQGAHVGRARLVRPAFRAARRARAVRRRNAHARAGGRGGRGGARAVESRRRRGDRRGRVSAVDGRRRCRRQRAERERREKRKDEEGSGGRRGQGAEAGSVACAGHLLRACTLLAYPPFAHC